MLAERRRARTRPVSRQAVEGRDRVKSADRTQVRLSDIDRFVL